MTTDTEALRAQFEKLLSDSGRACRYEGDGQYAFPHDPAWLWFQVGYAAAKAETAAAVAKERERIADLAADLVADACVEYANGRPMDFRTMVGDAIRAEGGGARR